MKIISVLFVLALLLAPALLHAGEPVRPVDKPNILFILADDQSPRPQITTSSKSSAAESAT